MPAVQTNAETNAKEISVSAVVTRCGCGDPLSHASLQLPCPQPKAIEDRGVVSYFHKNPLRRLLWEARQAWKEGRSK